MARSLAGAMLLAAAALTTPVAALAQSVPVSALSDTRTAQTGEAAIVALRAMRPLCPRGSAASASLLAAPKALSRSRALLQRRVGRRASSRLRSHRRSKRPRQAQDLAMVAVAGGNPAGALAGFLAAHERERRNPLHLLNASVMLTRLGKPREALSLIAAAERLPAPRRMPMGVRMSGLALNNRGFALIALRRYADAERLLGRAVRAEPLLAEAQLNLAMARVCRGRVNQAVAPYIAGQRRSVSGGLEVAALQPRAVEALDLSLGVPGEPPRLRFPATAEAGVATAAQWKLLKDQRYAHAGDLHTRAVAALEAMASNLSGKPSLQQRRTSEILGLYNERDRQRPEIAAAKLAVMNMEARLAQAYRNWQDENSRVRTECQQGNPTSGQIAACLKSRCPTEGHHATWVALIRETDANLRVFARELHRYAGAIASNYSDPVNQRAILLAAEHEIMTLYASHVVLQVETWTGVEDTQKDECGTVPGGDPSGEDGPADFPLPGACPPALQGVKIAFSVDFASFKINCESVSVQVSLPQVLSPFAQVSYDVGSGSTTVFVGARAGGKLPGLKANARAGIYMSFDSRGDPTDVGLRGQAGTGLDAPDFVDLPSIGGKADISLAGAFL